MVEGYCVRCRKKTPIENVSETTMKNGRPAVQGVCPACKTKIFKIGKRSEMEVPLVVSPDEELPTGGIAALPDSGERTSFGDGMAIREADPDKASIEGVSPYAMFRLGRLFTKGGIKYGDFRNWEKGMPMMRCAGAILRHTFQWMMRDESEDHMAAVMWNAQAVMHYEEVKPELDDRPRWTDD